VIVVLLHAFAIPKARYVFEDPSVFWDHLEISLEASFSPFAAEPRAIDFGWGCLHGI
jgi:hypothetical protein